MKRKGKDGMVLRNILHFRGCRGRSQNDYGHGSLDRRFQDPATRPSNVAHDCSGVCSGSLGDGASIPRKAAGRRGTKIMETAITTLEVVVHVGSQKVIRYWFFSHPQHCFQDTNSCLATI